MKLFKSFLLLLFFSSLLFGQIKTKNEIVKEAKSKATHISIDEFKKMNKNDYLLIDVRTKEEYDAGHIAGALWIPRGMIEFKLPLKTDNPDENIILYCRSGGRASLAANSLKEIGYNNVKNLTGGFKEWTAQGNSIYNMHGEIKVINYLKKETDADQN